MSKTIAGVDVSFETKRLNDVNRLTGMVDDAMNEVDEHFGRKDFAHVVSLILKEGYGSHNFEGFVAELQEFLGLSTN
jgi:hypothetical protein